MKIFSGMIMFTTWDVRLAEEKLRAAGYQTWVRATLLDTEDDDYYETTWMVIWRPSEVDLWGHVAAIVKPLDGEVHEAVLEDEAEYRASLPEREAYLEGKSGAGIDRQQGALTKQNGIRWRELIAPDQSD